MSEDVNCPNCGTDGFGDGLPCWFCDFQEGNSEDERAQIVAWLRGARPVMGGGLKGLVGFFYLAIFNPTRLSELHYEVCASAIERLDHHKDTDK